MELDTHDIVPLHCSGERFDVVCSGCRVGGDGGLVGMGEIDEFPGFHTGQQSRAWAHIQRIPADMWDFLIAFGETLTRIGEMRHALLFGSLRRSGVEPL